MANQTRLLNGLTQKQFTFYNNLIAQMKLIGKMDVKQLDEFILKYERGY